MRLLHVEALHPQLRYAYRQTEQLTDAFQYRTFILPRDLGSPRHLMTDLQARYPVLACALGHSRSGEPLLIVPTSFAEAQYLADHEESVDWADRLLMSYLETTLDGCGQPQLLLRVHHFATGRRASRIIKRHIDDPDAPTYTDTQWSMRMIEFTEEALGALEMSDAERLYHDAVVQRMHNNPFAGLTCAPEDMTDAHSAALTITLSSPTNGQRFRQWADGRGFYLGPTLLSMSSSALGELLPVQQTLTWAVLRDYPSHLGNLFKVSYTPTWSLIEVPQHAQPTPDSHGAIMRQLGRTSRSAGLTDEAFPYVANAHSKRRGALLGHTLYFNFLDADEDDDVPHRVVQATGPLSPAQFTSVIVRCGPQTLTIEVHMHVPMKPSSRDILAALPARIMQLIETCIAGDTADRHAMRAPTGQLSSRLVNTSGHDLDPADWGRDECGNWGSASLTARALADLPEVVSAAAHWSVEGDESILIANVTIPDSASDAMLWRRDGPTLLARPGFIRPGRIIYERIDAYPAYSRPVSPSAVNQELRTEFLKITGFDGDQLACSYLDCVPHLQDLISRTTALRARGFTTTPWFLLTTPRSMQSILALTPAD